MSGEAVEKHSAITNSERLNTETQSTIESLKKTIRAIESTSASIEVRAGEVAEEVRSAFHRYKLCLEERERVLLKDIDESKQIKTRILLKQVDELKSFLSELSKSSELLTETLHSSHTSEIVQVNEIAEDHLQQMQNGDLLPAEPEIYFTPPHTSLLSAIRASGSINGSRAIVGLCGVVVKKEETKPIVVFGSEGDANGQFSSPWGLCCDNSGQIIVSDTNNHRIQVFNCDGTFLYKFGRNGCKPGEFHHPQGVAVNPQGNIVVADEYNNRVQVFKSDGTFLFKFGDEGSNHGQFNFPWGVACNSMGEIAVSEEGNHRIQLFTPDGVFLNKYVLEHNSILRGVSFLPNGDVIVADEYNGRLVIINPLFTDVKLIVFNERFMAPHGVCSDCDGSIIVADQHTNSIQVLGNNGNLLWKFGHFGHSAGDFFKPAGVCVTPSGSIVVLETRNNRVQLF